MFEKFEDMILTTLVQKLNDYGIKVDPEKIKNAFANYPNLVQEVESILAASTPEEREAKIKALIKEATSSETEKETDTTTTSSKT